MMRAITIAVVVAGSIAVGHAAPAAHLGAAFRAYDAGDLATARSELAQVDHVANRDYLWWLRGMVALRSGDATTAEAAFRKAAKVGGSRFAAELPWRLADCAWLRNDRQAAAKTYGKLITAANAEDAGDVGTAMYRIAEVANDAAAYRTLVVAHPSHPLAAAAEAKMLALGGVPLTGAERVARAEQLTAAHLWDQAVVELALVGDDAPDAVKIDRDYWLGETLFDMRRRYGDAGVLLLGVANKVGSHAVEAMFHGARALSRADHDDDAIIWYQKVVATYPSTPYAVEAQFLSGWLEFNRGHYKEAIAPLERSLAMYPHGKWVDDSLWFLGMSHYFLGDLPAAKLRLDALAARTGALEAGKARYWLGRIEQRLGDEDKGIADYREVVTRYPFSWYALLSRARLAQLNRPIGPFGDQVSPKGPKLAAAVDETLAKDSLIERADEPDRRGDGRRRGVRARPRRARVPEAS